MKESQWSHLSVVRTGFAIHLMEPHLSKGEGLRYLFDRMGWSPDDALCVGDAPNDLPMFDFLRWAVAVGGAFRLSKKQPMSSHLIRTVQRFRRLSMRF